VFVPLLMVVEVQCPDAQLTLMLRLHGVAADSGTAARTRRERTSSNNRERGNGFLLSVGLVTLRGHCPNHICYL